MAYPEALLEHYRRPRHRGRLAKTTGTGHVLNPLCGDEITVDVVVADGVVQDVGFEGVGCAISLGAADMVAEHLVGRAARDAVLDLDGVQETIGMHVPPGRRKCAMLAAEALASALP